MSWWSPAEQRPVGRDAIAWATECQKLGAGVILPTSMDGDGTQAGYDLEFTRAISDAVTCRLSLQAVRELWNISMKGLFGEAPMYSWQHRFSTTGY